MTRDLLCQKCQKCSYSEWYNLLFSFGGKFGIEGKENKLNMITLLSKLKTLQLVSNYDPIQYLKC
jgi:hypothetical protein